MKKLLGFVAFLAIFSQPFFAQKPEHKVAAIGFYNLENLFDTLDTPDKMDEEFTPSGANRWDTEKYLKKQANLAKVIAELATELTPDGVAVLGVAEVENRAVLEDLVRQDPIRKRNYQVCFIEGPDERGIDPGFLYNPKYFKLLGARANRVRLVNADGVDQRPTRDIVLMSGVFDGDTMHFLNGHWPSRRGGEAASEFGRLAAAAVCKRIIDSIYASNLNAKIVLMGDLNDDPTNRSLKEVLQTGTNPKKMGKTGLFAPMELLFKEGRGTLAYRDAWSLFDQMVVSKPLVSQKVGGWQFYKAEIFSRPWLVQQVGTFKGYPFRTFDGAVFMNGYSDHLPVYFFVLNKIGAAKKDSGG